MAEPEIVCPATGVTAASPWIDGPVEAFFDHGNDFTLDDLERLWNEHSQPCIDAWNSAPPSGKDVVEQTVRTYGELKNRRVGRKQDYQKYYRVHPDGNDEERNAIMDQVHDYDKQLRDLEEGTTERVQDALVEHGNFCARVYDERSLLVASTIQEMGGVEHIQKRYRTSEPDSIDDQDLRNLHALYHQQPEPKLLKEMTIQGGPNAGQWTRAIAIYRNILAIDNIPSIRDASNPYFPCHSRLAMAFALEFAKPIRIFDTDTPIDPVKRFRHYVDAHLKGELDPGFSYFTTFEYRQAIYCNASEEDLQWARDYLVRFRPSQMADKVQKCRYTSASRTDVGYRDSFWPEGETRTYKHMVSGGGKCGARAQYARYVCRAHGVPTWGCKQPGHAALSRWTPDQWVLVLGLKGWSASYWEGTSGQQFLDDVNGRAYAWNFPDKLPEYYQQVTLSRCMANVLQEVYKHDHSCFIHHSAYWTSVYRMQRKLWGNKGSAFQDFRLHERNSNNPKAQEQIQDADVVRTRVEKYWDHLKGHNRPKPPEIEQPNDGSISIGAGNYKDCFFVFNEKTYPLFNPHRLEHQIILRKGKSHVTYMLDRKKNLTSDHSLTFLICNVHVQQRDLIVTFESVDGDKEALTIPIPYTAGEWAWTDPAPIPKFDLFKSMRFTRGEADFGDFALVIRMIKFVPNDADGTCPS